MKIKNPLLVAALSLSLGLSAGAFAEEPSTESDTAPLKAELTAKFEELAKEHGESQPVEDEIAVLKSVLALKYPEIKFQSVALTPIKGLYEIVHSQKILYTDLQADYILYGSIYDMKQGRDITAERTTEVVRTDMTPLQDAAITEVKGDGSRTLHIFTDPACPYCAKLEETLKDLDNVTIKRYVFHIISGDPTLVNKIWCSGDNDARLAAFQAYQVDKTIPNVSAEALKACEPTAETILEFARDNALSSTPTMLSADGRVERGAIPLEAIEAFLNKQPTADK